MQEFWLKIGAGKIVFTMSKPNILGTIQKVVIYEKQIFNLEELVINCVKRFIIITIAA